MAENDEINVLLEVHFDGGGHGLGVNEYSAVYVRTPGAKRFSFQTAYTGVPRKLKISRADFEALADLYIGPSNEDLIRYAASGLKEIATGRDGDAKNWLKELLANVSDTTQVRELRELLR